MNQKQQICVVRVCDQIDLTAQSNNKEAFPPHNSEMSA